MDTYTMQMENGLIWFGVFFNTVMQKHALYTGKSNNMYIISDDHKITQ